MQKQLHVAPAPHGSCFMWEPLQRRMPPTASAHPHSHTRPRPERSPILAPEAPLLRATLPNMDEVLAARRARPARHLPRLAGAMIAFPLLFASAAFAETHPGQEQLVREVANVVAHQK